jgi:hypothetical protein
MYATSAALVFGDQAGAEYCLAAVCRAGGVEMLLSAISYQLSAFS